MDKKDDKKDKAIMNTTVELIPRDGCYQPHKYGIIIGETKTQWRVKITNSVKITDNGRCQSFYKQNGMPVAVVDKNFPCYKLNLKSIHP